MRESISGTALEQGSLFLNRLERCQIIILQQLDLLIRQSTVQWTQAQQRQPQPERRRATAAKATVVLPEEMPDKKETEVSNPVGVTIKWLIGLPQQIVKLPTGPVPLSSRSAIDPVRDLPYY